MREIPNCPSGSSCESADLTGNRFLFSHIREKSLRTRKLHWSTANFNNKRIKFMVMIIIIISYNYCNRLDSNGNNKNNTKSLHLYRHWLRRFSNTHTQNSRRLVQESQHESCVGTAVTHCIGSLEGLTMWSPTIGCVMLNYYYFSLTTPNRLFNHLLSDEWEIHTEANLTVSCVCCSPTFK